MNTETRIQLVQGDITRLDVDAIVTAANAQLMGGGGVDGAVHDAAGPELVAASRKLAPCPAGDARITPGFALKPKVIHAVGPIYGDGLSGESELLASAYRSSLELASSEHLDRVAFPCISTGAYGFPQDEACEIAIQTVVRWQQSHPRPAVVIFCCFGNDDFRRYRDRLSELGLAD